MRNPFRLGILFSINMLVGVVLIFMVQASVVMATGTDFDTINFVAANPNSYSHLTGGGAYDDGTIPTDIVGSISFSDYDFACGDVVTFLTLISVVASPSDVLQTIELDYSFLANSTGQPGMGFREVTYAGINYGVVAGGDGVGGIDSGINDDGGSTATIISESLNGTLNTTIQIDDLEAGEDVVLRLDVRLYCDVGADPTGFLQAQLVTARVVQPTTAEIVVGAQSISVSRVGDRSDPLDFGDLPDLPYSTLLPGGARHTIDLRSPYLGSCVDAEADGQQNAGATGDDFGSSGYTVGSCSVSDDDNDGVIFIPGPAGGGGWSSGTVDPNDSDSAKGGGLMITITGGSSTNSATPQVFIDNGSNTLSEVQLRALDGSLLSMPLAAGTHTVYFDIPTNFFDGVNDTTVYTRVRLSTSGGLSAGGAANDGEVEDYVFNLDPTSITLLDFRAIPDNQSEGVISAFVLFIGIVVIVFFFRNGD